VPTLYVVASRESAWHILRPNERLSVWCRNTPEDTLWRYLALRVPANICPTCRDAETVDVSAGLNRVPALAATF
jgi:hypothetical protein